MVLNIVLAPLVFCATAWVRRRQAAVLRSGIALTDEQQNLARAVGVNAVERVRVVAARVVPLPLPLWACSAAQRAGWLSPHIAGMTLGYGIVLRADCFNPEYCDQRLLAHELSHVAQYERLGGVHGFLRQYVRECVWPGYPRGALEIEAQAAEARGSVPQADVIPYASAANSRTARSECAVDV